MLILLCHFSARCDHVTLFVLRCKSLNGKCIADQDENTEDVAGSFQKTWLLPSCHIAHPHQVVLREVGRRPSLFSFPLILGYRISFLIVYR